MQRRPLSSRITAKSSAKNASSYHRRPCLRQCRYCYSAHVLSRTSSCLCGQAAQKQSWMRCSPIHSLVAVAGDHMMMRRGTGGSYREPWFGHSRMPCYCPSRCDSTASSTPGPLAAWYQRSSWYPQVQQQHHHHQHALHAHRMSPTSSEGRVHRKSS